MAESWPENLSDKQQLAIERRIISGSIVTEMESGALHTRKRFKKKHRERFIFNLNFTGEELQLFDTFYFDTLNNGVEAFKISSPLTDDTIHVKFTSYPNFNMQVGNSDPDKRRWRGRVHVVRVGEEQ